MTINFLAPKFLVLYVFLGSTLYMHFRGRARLPLLRQIGNHSTLMAPYNVFLYAFSAVSTRPYPELTQFPELATLRDNWETIRDDARVLLGEGGLKAASDHVDIGFNSFFQRGWRRFYLKWYDTPPPSALALDLDDGRMVKVRSGVQAGDSVATTNAILLKGLSFGY